MFYGFATGAVSDPQFEFKHETSDIESLNQKARTGEFEVSAVSVHAFAHLGGSYAILRSGASMGGTDYGPILAAAKPFDILDGRSRTFAIPGELTSAALALRMFLRQAGVQAELVNMHFDVVQDAVKRGEVDAGVIIHEGQLTHRKLGLTSILDLGQWWWEDTRLPLPLGVNIVRKDIGEEAMRAVARVLRESIEYALNHRKEAIEYSLTFGRGLSYEEADKFISMYVNERTRDLGTEGMESIGRFLRRGAELGLVPAQQNLEFF